MTEQELKPQVKEEAPAKGERVRPGRVFLPAVDIFETPQALVLVADMPGVKGDDVGEPAQETSEPGLRIAGLPLQLPEHPGDEALKGFCEPPPERRPREGYPGAQDEMSASAHN